MPIELKIPSVGESITEVEIGQWYKNKGDSVAKDDLLLVVESDKATVEIRAPQSATLVDILKNTGEGAAVGEVIAHLEANTDDARDKQVRSGGTQSSAEPPRGNGKTENGSDGDTRGNAALPREMTPSAPAETYAAQEEKPPRETGPSERDMQIIPAKETAAQQVQDESVFPGRASTASRRDEAVRMTALRRHIAERLVQAQQSAALLTTINEIDMSAVVALRQTQGEAFQEKHRIKLGFMSFFVKAAVIALQSVREVNAEIRGNDIVYHNYFDIGIAVGGGKGLVVPVLRNAEQMSFAEVERAIDDFARRAKDGRLKPEELQGGTFTITNGGVYGSLLSTPIVNPPQSAILGLHAIQDRPVARAGAVVIRPLMYVALTYDHRIIDGREAVLFLKQIKTMIEEPARMLLQF